MAVRQSPSFPNASIGNPDEPGAGPPIATFWGDAFGANAHKCFRYLAISRKEVHWNNFFGDVKERGEVVAPIGQEETSSGWDVVCAEVDRADELGAGHVQVNEYVSVNAWRVA